MLWKVHLVSQSYFWMNVNYHSLQNIFRCKWMPKVIKLEAFVGTWMKHLLSFIFVLVYLMWNGILLLLALYKSFVNANNGLLVLKVDSKDWKIISRNKLGKASNRTGMQRTDANGELCPSQDGGNQALVHFTRCQIWVNFTIETCFKGQYFDQIKTKTTHLKNEIF